MKILTALLALVFSATMALGASFPDYVPGGDTSSQMVPLPIPAPSTVITPATGNFTWVEPKSYGSFTVSGEGTSTSHRCNMIKLYGDGYPGLFVLAFELKPILTNRPAYAFIDVIDVAFDATSVKSGAVRVTVEDDDQKISKMLHWSLEEVSSTKHARIKMHTSFFLAMAHFKILTLTFMERNDVLFELNLNLDGGKEAVEAHFSCVKDYVKKYKNNPNDFPVR